MLPPENDDSRTGCTTGRQCKSGRQGLRPAWVKHFVPSSDGMDYIADDEARKFDNMNARNKKACGQGRT